MVTKVSAPIDYGDNVKIRANSPSPFEPNLVGSACGFRIVQNEMEAKAIGFAVGPRLWLVEVGDGSSFEVPEKFLEKVSG